MLDSSPWVHSFVLSDTEGIPAFGFQGGVAAIRVDEEDFAGAGDCADLSDASFGFGGDGAEKKSAFGRDSEEEGIVFAAVEGELEGVKVE